MFNRNEAALKTIINLQIKDSSLQAPKREPILHNRFDEELWLLVNEGMSPTIQSNEEVEEILSISYVVTGKNLRGKRFAPKVSSSKAWAMSINLFDGSVWEETEYKGGKKKRKLLKRVTN